MIQPKSAISDLCAMMAQEFIINDRFLPFLCCCCLPRPALDSAKILESGPFCFCPEHRQAHRTPELLLLLIVEPSSIQQQQREPTPDEISDAFSQKMEQRRSFNSAL